MPSSLMQILYAWDVTDEIQTRSIDELNVGATLFSTSGVFDLSLQIYARRKRK